MERTIINYYVEEEQDLDKVLNIFIRVNSAGTVLGYSDLLLSMATAEWTYDAREEINRLVEDLNDNGTFEFTKDFVLKACDDCKFTNPICNGKLHCREHASQFGLKLILPVATTRLLGCFGFTGATLPSINAVLPIVYYVFIRDNIQDNPNNFLESSNFKVDRNKIKRWLCKALLKRIFSGQPDSTLQPIRETIRSDNTNGFPSEQIEQTLLSHRTMQFTPEDVEAILEEKYGSGYTFSVSLLYPWIDYGNKIHQDHIHPKSHFTKRKLTATGFSDDEIKVIQGQVDQIPNLQLLQGTINTEKSNKPFNEWLNEQYPLEDEQHYYMRNHYVPDEDFTIEKFSSFFDARRELMKDRLYEIVGLDKRG